MSAKACSRSWQAEALEDGRLPAADRSAFERHAATCAICRRESAELARLRELTRRLPAEEASPLEQRRALSELLRRANEETTGTRPRAVPRGIAVVMVLAVLSAVVLLAGRRALRTPEVASDGPSFSVIASRGAEWHVLERGPRLRLGAESGRLEIAVHKLRAAQRFVVELPDGALEVRGTRFVLTVERSHTLGVEVEEGLVALRLRNQPELLLARGQRWGAPSLEPLAPAAAPGASSAGKVTEPASPRAVPVGQRRSAVGRVRASRELSSSAPEAESSSVSNAPAPDAASSSASNAPASKLAPRKPAAGELLETATSALKSHDYALAQRALAEFERSYPADGRLEDVLYLEAVARWRSGDAAGARRAAARYLEHYPHGLRQPEARRMLDAQ